MNTSIATSETVIINKMLALASPSTLVDIKSAWDFRKETSMVGDVVTGNWIYTVDPETMQEVKLLWEYMPNDWSLFKTFCRLLKRAK